MALLREVFTWTQKLRYLLSITRRTSIFFDSNRGAKYMSIPAKVRRDLGRLTDMKTGTSDINRDLSKEREMVLTPQQTRCILRQVLGSTTLERTKTILDDFADGNVGKAVLFVQDQMDITCVIAMQTATQKKCFCQWGDTLFMDWTHGTNNLGYNLGNIKC